MRILIVTCKYFSSEMIANAMRLRSAFLMLALLFPSTLLAGQQSVQDVVIIANPSIEHENLSRNDVRSIFTMKKKFWANGIASQVFVLNASSDAHKVFCRKQLKIFPRQLESVWYRLEYSGTGSRPIEVQSIEEMIQKVSVTPGAIGYIPVESLNETVYSVTVK